MGKHSRNKGARFERTLVRYYNTLFGEGSAKRTLQSRGGRADGADVVLLERYHIEAKRQERICFWDALRQAERDVNDGMMPVVIAKRNNCRPVAMTSLGVLDFMMRSDVLLGQLVGALKRGDMDEIEAVLQVVHLHNAAGYVKEVSFAKAEALEGVSDGE